MNFKKKIQSVCTKLIEKLVPNLKNAIRYSDDFVNTGSMQYNNWLSLNVKIDKPYRIYNSKILEYTYISVNSRISETQIGKFCSIGPNLLCGWGVHPTNGLSTSPMFYSPLNQNGYSYAKVPKIEERKLITIGNDVFIGMNVTIVDGVNIGNGAVIAAGAVVSSDVPDYAVVGGVPAKILNYRFEKDIIEKLLKIKWWDWEENKLYQIEKYFFDIEDFVNKFSDQLD